MLISIIRGHDDRIFRGNDRSLDGGPPRLARLKVNCICSVLGLEVIKPFILAFSPNESPNDYWHFYDSRNLPLWVCAYSWIEKQLLKCVILLGLLKSKGLVFVWVIKVNDNEQNNLGKKKCTKENLLTFLTHHHGYVLFEDCLDCRELAEALCLNSDYRFSAVRGFWDTSGHTSETVAEMSDWGL